MMTEDTNTEAKRRTDPQGRLEALVSIPRYAAAYKSELERASGRRVDIERRGSWWYVYVHGWGDWVKRKTEIMADTDNLLEWADGELWAQFRKC